MTNREVDALIAEKLMEWKRFKNDRGVVLFLAPNSFNDGGYLQSLMQTGRLQETSEPGDEENAHYYSTDRNAAAKVLERIGELGLKYKFLNELIPEDAISGEDLCWDLVNSAPRQICDAALAAVEGVK